MGWEQIKDSFGWNTESSSPPRNSSSPFDASADELWRRALSNPEKGEGTILLKVEESFFRYIPSSIVESSRALLSETGDAVKVARYIENAFYIYRATVCTGWVAVLHKNGDAYEWPSPSKFSWSSIDAVLLGGEHIHGPILDASRGVVVTTPVAGGREERTEFNVGPSGEILGSVTRVEDVVPSRDSDFLHKNFRYKIPDAGLVGFIGQQSWQNNSLRAFANPLYFIISDSVKGILSPVDARKHVETHLENLSKAYPCAVAIYVRSGETPDAGACMMFMM